MEIQTHYVTYTQFNNGLGHACDPTDFDGACDAYAEEMNGGKDSVVFRIVPPKGGFMGTMTDVTGDARDHIARRLRSRGYDFPKWLIDEHGGIETDDIEADDLRVDHPDRAAFGMGKL